LFGKDSSHHKRLFDLTAYAFYSQIPLLSWILATALFYQPPHLTLGWTNDQELIKVYVNQYLREVRSSLPLVCTTVSQYYFQAWLMGLMVAGLSAIAKLSWQRAVGYGALLYGLFILIPAALL
jgi:hypothetical protein